MFVRKLSSFYARHTPVMSSEIMSLLKPEDGKVFIDMTFGGGGHSKALLNSNKSITIVAVDRDPSAYTKAQELSRAVPSNQKVIPIHGKFSSVMKKIHLSGIPFGTVDGIIFDLGASSIQLDDPSRGFALSLNGELDMRMDTSDKSAITAEDVVNNLDVKSLAHIFKIYGDERRSLKIANAIEDAKTLLGRIKTTQELAKIIQSSNRASFDSLGRHAHAGTRVFQALRIFVNNELNELNYAIEKMRDFLRPSKNSDNDDCDSAGIAVVLTFHSLEDKIVKRHFNHADPNEPDFKATSQHDRIETRFSTDQRQIENINKNAKWKPVYKHIVKPTPEEILFNARSRSAKLRAAFRLN